MRSNSTIDIFNYNPYLDIFNASRYNKGCEKISNIKD